MSDMLEEMRKEMAALELKEQAKKPEKSNHHVHPVGGISKLLIFVIKGIILMLILLVAFELLNSLCTLLLTLPTRL